jgi:hypothetical protein
MTKKLRTHLAEAQSMPMSEQGDFLKRAFEKWQGKEAQIDDILLVGFQI